MSSLARHDTLRLIRIHDEHVARGIESPIHSTDDDPAWGQLYAILSSTTTDEGARGMFEDYAKYLFGREGLTSRQRLHLNDVVAPSEDILMRHTCPWCGSSAECIGQHGNVVKPHRERVAVLELTSVRWPVRKSVKSFLRTLECRVSVCRSELRPAMFDDQVVALCISASGGRDEPTKNHWRYKAPIKAKTRLTAMISMLSRDIMTASEFVAGLQ